MMSNIIVDQFFSDHSRNRFNRLFHIYFVFYWKQIIDKNIDSKFIFKALLLLNHSHYFNKEYT